MKIIISTLFNNNIITYDRLGKMLLSKSKKKKDIACSEKKDRKK